MRIIRIPILLSFVLASFFAGAEPAIVISDSAVVFEKPDFDSPVVSELPVGEKVEASLRAFGMFHRVKLPDGRMGFLDDSEFRFQNPKVEKSAKSQAQPALGSKADKMAELNRAAAKRVGAKNTEKVKRPARSFTMTNFRGLSYQSVNFKEQTMGIQPQAYCDFYGFKMVGPNLLVEGDMITELNVDLFPSAPSYYQKATGHGADGWIMHTDMMVQMQSSEGKNVMTFFGFGPMFRFSSFNVALNNGAGSNSYSLQDMVLGVVFDAGLGIRAFGNQLRFEYKYYWEKMQYAGLGVSYLISL